MTRYRIELDGPGGSPAEPSGPLTDVASSNWDTLRRELREGPMRRLRDPGDPGAFAWLITEVAGHIWGRMWGPESRRVEFDGGVLFLEHG